MAWALLVFIHTISSLSFKTRHHELESTKYSIVHCPKKIGSFRDIDGNVNAKKLFTWEKFEIGYS